MTDSMESTMDVVIEGATVLTAEPDRPVIEDGVVGISGNRLAVVAARSDLREVPRARRHLDARGRVVTPGFVNVHTHAILTMVRGVAEDMGFAPAYTPGVPHGHDVTPDEAVALGRLGALEALLFGSTLVNDSYVHAGHTLPAMGETGMRVWSCGRIHDVDFSRVHEQVWEHKDAIGERTLGDAVALVERWHGAMDGRLGVHLAAHAPDTCSRRLLERVRDTAARYGLGVNTHLAQSRIEVERIREREGISPAELLDDIGLLNERLVAAHCLFLDDDDFERVGNARDQRRPHSQGQRHRRHRRADVEAAAGGRAHRPRNGQHARGHGGGHALGTEHRPFAGGCGHRLLAARGRLPDGDPGRRPRPGCWTTRSDRSRRARRPISSSSTSAGPT